MARNEMKRKYKKVSILLWAALFITTIVMAALILGNVFTTDEIWIPLIPVGVLIIIAIAATIINFSSYSRKRMSVVGIWAVVFITAIVMAALIIGDIFSPEEYWIPSIPIGCLSVLAIVLTILEFTTGEVKYCPKCGRLFEKKWDFCQECGTRIIMKCPNCDEKIKGNPKYCVKCGINLSEVDVLHGSATNIKFNIEGYTNTCENCGAPAKPEAKYCVFCGAAQ